MPPDDRGQVECNTVWDRTQAGLQVSLGWVRFKIPGNLVAEAGTAP